jgi:hypothetical protein
VDIYEGPTGGVPQTGEDLEWDTPQEMPGQLWVQPKEANDALGDIELKLSFDPDHAYDSVKLTVYEVALKSVTLLGKASAHVGRSRSCCTPVERSRPDG